MDAFTRQNYEWATAPRIHTHCTQVYTARNKFLPRDQASTVSLVPNMHLTGKKIFALLLIFGGIETNPGPTPCAICHRSNWNQCVVWCGHGRWVQLKCTNLQSIEQWNNKFDCKHLLVQDNRRKNKAKFPQDNTHLNILQLKCNSDIQTKTRHSKKTSRGPQNNATKPRNKQTCSSQNQKIWIEFVQTLTQRGNCSKFWSTVNGLWSSNAKPPAKSAIYFGAKKTTPHHDPRKCANKFNKQNTPHPMKKERKGIN